MGREGVLVLEEALGVEGSEVAGLEAEDAGKRRRQSRVVILARRSAWRISSGRMLSSRIGEHTRSFHKQCILTNE